MTEPEQPSTTWWGSFNLAENQTGQWHIGPLKLAVQRLANEWRIAYQRDKTADADLNGWQHIANTLDINELNYSNLARYTFTGADARLSLRPALPDRPMITRPLTSFSVPAGEKTTMYVSSPLWVQIESGRPAKLLQEVPIQRPSDTWFGPSPMEGELCYASRTHARLRFEHLSIRFHRAVTQVVIDNRATSTLLVERFSLPAPYLSLFATPDGLLWTQAVTMVRQRDTGMAAFEIESRPLLEQAATATLVSGPREYSGQNMVVRAFGALFR